MSFCNMLEVRNVFLRSNFIYKVGTSVKTRNVLTRADTLGVGSKWDSEEDYGEGMADSRARTAMTTSTLSGDGYMTPASATAWNGKKKMLTCTVYFVVICI